MQRVAPHVGAWIETNQQSLTWIKSRSHPMWVRGLKRNKVGKLLGLLRSHPMWVRGLKQFQIHFLVLTSGRTPCGCVD